MKMDQFNEVIATNLGSAFLTLSVCGKAMMRTGGGRMVFTSSVAAGLGLVNHEAIAAAKGGLEAMVRSAAATYAKRGLRINAVAPSLTETRLAEPMLRSEAARARPRPWYQSAGSANPKRWPQRWHGCLMARRTT